MATQAMATQVMATQVMATQVMATQAMDMTPAQKTSYLKQVIDIFGLIKSKTLVIDLLSCFYENEWHEKFRNNHCYSASCVNEDSQFSFAIEVKENEDLKECTIKSIAFEKPEPTSPNSPYCVTKLIHNDFPIMQHPCMPIHFQETFVFWLTMLPNNDMPYSHTKHMVCALADHLHNMDMYASFCQIFKKASTSKLHALPKELRNKIYTMVLQDPRN